MVVVVVEEVVVVMSVVMASAEGVVVVAAGRWVIAWRQCFSSTWPRPVWLDSLSSSLGESFSLSPGVWVSSPLPGLEEARRGMGGSGPAGCSGAWVGSESGARSSGSRVEAPAWREGSPWWDSRFRWSARNWWTRHSVLRWGGGGSRRR